MFDSNVKLGHWPYRPVRGLDALLAAMDSLGVTHAAVSSLSAVHFLNPHDGNEELCRTIAPYGARLTPLAVLRPNFSGWREDLDVCLSTLGMRGVVLFPNYHEFSLDDPCLAPLMTEAARHGIPVCVQSAMEDIRRQFRPYKAADMDAASIGAFARAYPATNVIALGLKFGQPETLGEPLPPNLFFDTSNYETQGAIEYAVDRFGPDRILLGSNFPMFNFRANLDKLRCARIADEAHAAIGFQNAQRLFRGK